MAFMNEYRELYEKMIVKKAKTVILRFNPVNRKYVYKPYSHEISDDALDKLTELIIENFVFYSFYEDEVVVQNKQFGLLDDLLAAAKYAYKQRLPKRNNASSDGTVGEILLDILIQVFEPVSKKLIARPKYKQQGDNSEIKGYDALYFTKNDTEISLWLGQAKTGIWSYCKSGIIKDLNSKYVIDYLADSVFYIADKAERESELQELLNEINRMCFENYRLNHDSETKMLLLIELLKNRKVKIKIPCLLVHTADDIYVGSIDLDQKMDEYTHAILESFDHIDFSIINDLDYEIFFLLFPVSDINKLRENVVDFKKGV